MTRRLMSALRGSASRHDTTRYRRLAMDSGHANQPRTAGICPYFGSAAGGSGARSPDAAAPSSPASAARSRLRSSLRRCAAAPSDSAISLRHFASRKYENAAEANSAIIALTRRFSGPGRSSPKTTMNRPSRPSVYLMAGLTVSLLSAGAVAEPPQPVEPDQAIHHRQAGRADRAADQGGERAGGETGEGHPGRDA